MTESDRTILNVTYECNIIIPSKMKACVFLGGLYL